MTELLKRHGRLGLEGGGRVGFDMAPSRIYWASIIGLQLLIPTMDWKRVEAARRCTYTSGLSDVEKMQRQPSCRCREGFRRSGLALSAIGIFQRHVLLEDIFTFLLINTTSLGEPKPRIISITGSLEAQLLYLRTNSQNFRTSRHDNFKTTVIQEAGAS